MGVLNPITAIIRSFAFIILAFGLTNLGGYAGTYGIIAVIDVIGIFAVSRVDETRIRQIKEGKRRQQIPPRRVEINEKPPPCSCEQGGGFKSVFQIRADQLLEQFVRSSSRMRVQALL